MSNRFLKSSSQLLTKQQDTDMAEEYDQDEFTIYDEVGRGNIDRGRVRDDIRWFEIEAEVVMIYYDSPRYETVVNHTLYGCIGLSNPKQIISREVVGVYSVVEHMKKRVFDEYAKEGFSQAFSDQQADWVIESFPHNKGQ